jgi:hypothetical protein
MYVNEHIMERQSVEERMAHDILSAPPIPDFDYMMLIEFAHYQLADVNGHMAIEPEEGDDD